MRNAHALSSIFLMLSLGGEADPLPSECPIRTLPQLEQLDCALAKHFDLIGLPWLSPPLLL